VVQQPLVVEGLLIIEALLSHSDRPHLVGILWMFWSAIRIALYVTTLNSHKR